jgi:hypothetical protein
MVLAFLSAAGLMAWLRVKAAPVEVEVVEGDGVGIVEENMATLVANDVFGTNPMAQADMLIELRGLLVDALQGSEVLFLEVPIQGSYLTRMLPEVVASGVVVERGATVTVTGRVYAMSDSVADSWVASGGISEGERIVALFAESFFEAEEVTVTAEPDPDEN